MVALNIHSVMMMMVLNTHSVMMMVVLNIHSMMMMVALNTHSHQFNGLPSVQFTSMMMAVIMQQHFVLKLSAKMFGII